MWGLVPVYHFGKLAGVECPVMEAIIKICNVYNDANSFESGITPEKLGLGGKGVKEILQYLE